MRPLPVSCFVVSFSYWTGDMSALWFQVFLFETDVRVSDTDRLRMRRASSDEPHACLVYHFVVVWVVWNNPWFLVWLFAIAVMSSRWRYLFVGTALMTRPKSWPVGTDHCSICYCFQGNVTTYAFELRHYLDTNLRAEICVTAINMGLKTSNDPLHLSLKEVMSNAYPWVTLLQRKRHLCRLPWRAVS